LNFLFEQREKSGVPISRLIAIAIDNELDAVEPFNYSLEFPDEPFLEMQYVDEGGKILRYLNKFGETGTPLINLILGRREVGIENRRIFLLAYREILHLGLVEEYVPRKRQESYVRVLTQRMIDERKK